MIERVFFDYFPGSSKKGKTNGRPSEKEEREESGLDLSDLDLSSIEFSEREMRALSGLTPALSRRLQRQLLAHLPPAAARDLRRTLSLHAPAPRDHSAARAARSHSASKSLDSTSDVRARTTTPPPPTLDTNDVPSCDPTPIQQAYSPSLTDERSPEDATDCASPQYSTLPRLRRRSSPRDDGSESVCDARVGLSSDAESMPSSRRASADRPLLSKYLTPERNLSLDEPYPPESSSILSEPSYIAAYGGGATGPLSLRRHSLRLAGDAPRKRVSRFLRSDFFDSPTDESLYAKHKKEKELETQKILREIREKRNRAAEATSKNQADIDDSALRKCVSPVNSIIGKERSRSNTPFFPSLDNIKETAIDASGMSGSKLGMSIDSKQRTRFDDSVSKDSKLIRPKSYPVKTLDSIDEPSENIDTEAASTKEIDNRDKRESKLIRPKSYPTSSPSPEKVYISCNIKKDNNKDLPPKEVDTSNSDVKTDVDVSFSITLPRKKSLVLPKPEEIKNIESEDQTKQENDKKSTTALTVKKYQITNNIDTDKSESKDHKHKNGNAIANGITDSTENKVASSENTKTKASNGATKKDEFKKSSESEPNEKKGTIKKKIIKKVSSKSKTDIVSSQDVGDAKTTTEKKKVTKKVKDKTDEETGKPATVTKKKSMLQSIGHKLEKFASSKSSSPEKLADSSVTNESKKDLAKLKRTQREHSVPVNVEPPTESNLIKRAVTLTDVAALEAQPPNNNKTTVSKVLGLFKKFEPKEKIKPIMEKSQSIDTTEISNRSDMNSDSVVEGLEKDKPRRPTSLLLNGLGRKNKYSRTTSDSVSNLTTENDDHVVLKKENDINSRNKNSLKLDFSRLPRVKKIVPTNPVIEPQIMNTSVDGENEKKDISEKNAITLHSILNDNHTNNRSRSRSRSIVSNSENKSDVSAEANKYLVKNPISPSDNGTAHPLRNHEPTSPEKDDIVDRIRRKSFYSRFNEKKQRRKSSLVGPGATEYDPLARIHAPPTEAKFDISPTSPGTYDLSPGLSASSDISPSTERYRSLLSEPISTRNNLRYDNYGMNDKIDTYRSLDRNDFRKYSGSRSYLDYDHPLSYGTQRYSRTKSLLDSSDGTEDNLAHSLKDPLKYNRTISMYSPGNYATYRPKRTHNPAIILKESEKEPSPENILEKIKQRKNFSISVTRKPDPVKDTPPRCVCFDSYVSRK